MQLFCPTCQTSHGGAEMCPRCGDRLLAPQESFVIAEVAAEPTLPELVVPSLPSRVFLGFLLSIGFVIAFGEFTIASFGNLTNTQTSLIHLVSVALGSLVAAAGQKFGSLAGLLVGFLAGAVLTFAQRAQMTQMGTATPVTPLGWSVAFPLLALVVGWLGSKIWPPLADSQIAPSRQQAKETQVLQSADPTRFPEQIRTKKSGRPTVWVRIMLGGLLAFSSVVASEAFRTILARGSLGLFQMGGTHNSGTIAAQVAVIFMILGGVIAGANTGAGVRHGLYTSILTIGGLFLASSTRDDGNFQPVIGLCYYLEQPVAPLLHPVVGGMVALATGLLVTAGGWLGATLFPPLAPPSLRSRRYYPV